MIVTPVSGVTQYGQGSFTTVNGQTHALGDVAFAVDESLHLPASSSPAPAPQSASATTPVLAPAMEPAAAVEVVPVAPAVSEAVTVPEPASAVDVVAASMPVAETVPAATPESASVAEPVPVVEVGVEPTPAPEAAPASEPVTSAEVVSVAPVSEPVPAADPMVTNLEPVVSTDPLADIMRQALSFNQWVASASTEVTAEPPIVFVANELITVDWQPPQAAGLVEPQRIAELQAA